MRKFFSIALLLAVGLVLTSACKKEKKEHKNHGHRKARVQKLEPAKHHVPRGFVNEAELEVDELLKEVEGKF